MTVGNPDWVASSAAATCEWTRFGQNHWDMGGYFASCAAAPPAGSGLTVPPSIFGIIQSMSFTRGTGDTDDVLVGCPAETAAAEAATETSTQSLTTTAAGTTAYDYFMAVVQQNQPYTPDGTETQEFIDMYACATTLSVGFNGTPIGPAPPPGQPMDYAAGEHACNGQLGMDYGGNPSYFDVAANVTVSCGYANVVELVADHMDWPAPGWYSGVLTIDASMNSPIACQARCLANVDCDYFSCKYTS